MSKLAQAIGQLVGMSMGGPQGAALGAAAGTLFTGGSFNQALQSGLGSFVNSSAMGKMGPQIDMINAVMGMSGQGASTRQGAIQAAQAGKPKAQMPQTTGPSSVGNIGSGIPQLLNNLGVDANNPMVMSMLLNAMEPRGSMLTERQQAQMRTGERAPEYKGTALPEYRAMGGYIEGPGTGTSDSIPAMIYQNGGPVQEARLSDGEFVMTEQAVRGAGNGDRAAGAAKMYKMMNQLEGRA